MKALINWLRDADKYHIKGRGDVYAGPCPFFVDKLNPDDMRRIYDIPWVISHPDAKDKLFRVIGFESFAISHINEGQCIGLLVNEIQNAD